MSRIGRKEIIVPAGVTASMNGNVITVKGALGELTQEVDKLITVNIDGGKITLARANDENKTKAKRPMSEAQKAALAKARAKAQAKREEQNKTTTPDTKPSQGE